jgi:hypothetical protein
VAVAATAAVLGARDRSDLGETRGLSSVHEASAEAATDATDTLAAALPLTLAVALATDERRLRLRLRLLLRVDMTAVGEKTGQTPGKARIAVCISVLLCCPD